MVLLPSQGFLCVTQSCFPGKPLISSRGDCALLSRGANERPREAVGLPASGQRECPLMAPPLGYREDFRRGVLAGPAWRAELCSLCWPGHEYSSASPCHCGKRGPGETRFLILKDKRKGFLAEM